MTCELLSAGPSSPDVMAWLRAGVPLTLLIDLMDPAGPRSGEILETERCRGRRR